MKKHIKTFLAFGLSCLILTACGDKDPSEVKIFVRNFNNQLVTGAQVIIIGDVNSNPATPAYVDTVGTNQSGFAVFNIQSLFDTYSKDADKVAFFDILVRDETGEATGEIKARENITAVETVNLPQ